MSAKSELDLVGIGWPVCLFKFNNAFDELCSSEVMEVLSQDPDVVDSILMLAVRSDGKLIKREQQGDLYRVFIQKV